jgi:pimeloyl-ACP methyl ester carboxylesterase/DNA-binding CsgD family transcriptional regulator
MTQETQPDVRYCASEDGVRIAYCVEGEGPPLLFCHYVYSFSLAHRVPMYNDAVRAMGQGRQMIRYDLRGTGLSQRDADDISPAADIRDIEAVARALGLERFFILGATVGGARAIEYAATHPDQVAGLILYESFSRLLDVYPRPLLQSFAQLCRTDWVLGTHAVADVAVRQYDMEEEMRWAQMISDSVTGETMARMMEVGIDLDVSHLLEHIGCPTLVCHSRNDSLWPFELGVRLAEGIPNARLVPLDGDNGGPFTDSQAAIEAMHAFLDEQRPPTTAVVMEAPTASRKPLTKRETEVLRLIAAGMTSKEISQELSLSVRTVGRHITNIYDKIGARSRADATAYALRNGLTPE